MLTKGQQEWINALSDHIVTIVPYDPRTDYLFNKIKNKVQAILGPTVEVEHCGASSFGISGQDEIDVSIVADKNTFDKYIPLLEKEFGVVKSRYEDRARFEAKEEGKKIDLKIIDANHPNAINGNIFEEYLRKNPEVLEKYRILKEGGNGLSMKSYYTRKTEFINDILARAQKGE